METRNLIMVSDGCQYCQMDTGGNHESNCPLARRDTTAFLMADIPPYSLTFSCTGCDAKDKEIDRLKDGLRKLEWCVPAGLKRIPCECPACKCVNVLGHKPDCWLAELLK